MIAALNSTSPRIAFVLATLICLVGVAFFIYEWLHPLPDRDAADLDAPASSPRQPQATPRARR